MRVIFSITLRENIKNMKLAQTHISTSDDRATTVCGKYLKQDRDWPDWSSNSQNNVWSAPIREPTTNWQIFRNKYRAIMTISGLVQECPGMKDCDE